MQKILIANRGEISIRAARAAREIGLQSVAIYSAEDRNSLHRQIADEAYQIGEAGHPVRAYLDIEGIVATALETGADAVYPGYGFLSESATFAQAVIDAGLTWIGPSPETLSLTGDKVRARDSAVRAGVQVLQASGALQTTAEAVAAAEKIGMPVFVKAAGGGGGRGLRRVFNLNEVAAAFETAQREAAAAFGDDTVFIEQAVIRPRHIEVQVLADGTGEVLHLFERDCSVQRRHQKVVEIAPAPNLPREVVTALCDDAVRFAKAVNYKSAGTVEFLVWKDPDAKSPSHVAGHGYAFIEMNPRIQVEHTVTEEATGMDILMAKMRIAAGMNFGQMRVSQDEIKISRTAIQCRLTTEDPSDDFRPSTGTINAYRSPGGPGIRLDGATYAGAEITPFYDSLLVKMTTSGRDFNQAARRARRALSEFTVRGVSCNVDFLRALLGSEEFLSGELNTAFLEDHPELLSAQPGAAFGEAGGLLLRLAETTVNRPNGLATTEVRNPESLLPQGRVDAPAETSRHVLDQRGPEALAKWLREKHAVAITDTTLRDAHQSLLATRIRTRDLLAGADAMDRLLPGLFSIECWGGATFDAALRFLGEDPWDRLVQMRATAPHLLTQMLIRGRNALGYAPYPEKVVKAFVAEAREAGMDIFRIFDALNQIDNSRMVIEAVREYGGYAEGTVCYTGDVLDPNEHTYTLDYYLRVAEDYVKAGAHGLCIKDMAGLLRPPAAAKLVTELRAKFDLPVRLHTHDTAGGQVATYMYAISAGVDGVDCASAPMASGGSQPSLGALLAALAHTDRDPSLDGGLTLASASSLEPYWNTIRDLYSPFEAGQRSPATNVYEHEIPGGQLSNLRAQAKAIGIGDKFSEVLKAYADANVLLGRPVKVTPSSKVVGDMAIWMVAAGVTKDQLLTAPEKFDLPASVIAYLHGQLGQPAGGFCEPFTAQALAGKAAPPEPVFNQSDLDALDEPKRRRDALTSLMLPTEAANFEKLRATYGNISVLPTRLALYGLDPHVTETVVVRPGQTMFVELDAVSEIDETGRRNVHMRANGQPVSFRVKDDKAPVTKIAHPKADASNPRHLAASVPGVITVKVKVGDEVKAGDRIAIIEAMKMESAVTAGVDGRVTSLSVTSGAQVEPGDLVAELG